MDKQGFKIIKNYFKDVALEQVEEELIALYVMQARKIAEYRGQIDYWQVNPVSLPDQMARIHELLEEKDKEALYQVQKMIPGSSIMQRVCGSMLSFVDSPALLEGPGLLINRPRTNRLLYKWHSEEHYYPKRRNFVNAWFPLFGDKTANNGTMSVRAGSHVKTYPFAEYHNGPNHFVQYEIPENFVTEFKEVPIEAKRGDLVLFHQGLVHRSNPNCSNRYSFAGVARIWTPKDDLSLAGHFCVAPYGNDIGREGLRVDP